MTSVSSVKLTSDRGRPRLLDLFCCEGGAGVGYHRAGFDVFTEWIGHQLLDTLAVAA